MDEWRDASAAAQVWLDRSFGPELARDEVRRARAVLGAAGSAEGTMFRSLVDHLGEVCTRWYRGAELEAATAVLLFGAVDPFARRYDAIPDRHWQRIVSLVAEAQAAHPDERAVSVVIAYGRGWRRATTGAGWDGRWPFALPALKALVAQSATLIVARDLIAGWGIDPSTFPAIEIEADASRSTVELDRGLCRCSKRTDRCLRPEAHSLAGWDPQACRFQAFLRQALRGTNQARLPPGFLPQGMLARSLEEEYGIIAGEVAVWRCASPGLPDHDHDGAWCARGRRWMNEAVDLRRAGKRIFVKAGFPHGTHIPVEFFRCDTCGHLSSGATCAHCGSHARRRKTVWVHQSGDVVEFGDPDRREHDPGGSET